MGRLGTLVLQVEFVGIVAEDDGAVGVIFGTEADAGGLGNREIFVKAVAVSLAVEDFLAARQKVLHRLVADGEDAVAAVEVHALGAGVKVLQGKVIALQRGATGDGEQRDFGDGIANEGIAVGIVDEAVAACCVAGEMESLQASAAQVEDMAVGEGVGALGRGGNQGFEPKGQPLLVLGKYIFQAALPVAQGNGNLIGGHILLRQEQQLFVEEEAAADVIRVAVGEENGERLFRVLPHQLRQIGEQAQPAVHQCDGIIAEHQEHDVIPRGSEVLGDGNQMGGDFLLSEKRHGSSYL